MSRQYRVGIVGFGMAGAVAAVALARDGHRVTLLERAPNPNAAGAGLMLQHSGQEILRRLGVLERVAAHAAPIDELYARQVTGRLLSRTRFADYAPGTVAYGVHRGLLFTALRELVEAEPIEVRPGCEVVARDAGADGSVLLRDALGQVHGPFDFVIAADGSRSRLREVCGFRARVCEYAHGTLWMIAPGTGLPRKLLQVVQRHHHLMGLLPMGDGLVTLYWGIRSADYPAIRARGLAALKEQVLAFAPEAEEVLAQVHAFEQLLFTNYRHVAAARWHDGRCILIGDAAHAMSPHLGQGANLAMVDAWRLAQALREHETPAAAFDAFCARQRAYLQYYQMTSRFLTPFFQSDWAILALGRDLVLPHLPRIPWVRRQMVSTVCGMKGGFLKGSIEI